MHTYLKIPVTRQKKVRNVVVISTVFIDKLHVTKWSYLTLIEYTCFSQEIAKSKPY